jgi:hypothetical protein
MLRVLLLLTLALGLIARAPSAEGARTKPAAAAMLRAIVNNRFDIELRRTPVANHCRRRR